MLQCDRNLVRPPVGYNNWDADKIQGCLCDEGWGGYACSERQCPFGKDPMQADYYKSPTYVLQCRANVGFFVMQIFGRWTDAIPYDADPGYLKFAIESVYDDSSVLIKMPASSSDGLPHVCGEDEIISTDIIFEELAGSLPPLLLTLNTSNTRRWPNGGTQLRLNRRSPILRMSTEHILTCPPCPNCYGNIYFIYEDSVSSAINVTIDGAKSAIERAILELDDLVEGGWTNLVVNVTIGDDSPSVADVDRVCSPTTTVTTRISLFSDYGNLPFLSILDGTYGGEFDPNSANITLTTNDGNGTLYECSNQGSCDRIRGRCQCFSALNYGEFQYRAFSSNGRGELGTRGDCGVMQINTDNCIVAGKDICAPNGFCLANTTRTCQCYDGWYGLTCNRRGCPKVLIRSDVRLSTLT